MSSDEAFDGLLGDLYYGTSASEPQRLRAFMLALGKHCRCSTVAYSRGQFASQGAQLSLTIDVATGEVDKVGAGNRWCERGWQDLKEGEIFDVDSSRLARLPMRHDDNAAHPARNAMRMLLCVAHSAQGGAFLLLRRSPTAGAFDRNALRLLREVAPHLVIAYRLRMRFMDLEAMAAQPTLHHHGMFVLDAKWRWVGGNAIAERMVADGWWRGKSNALLDANHPVTRTRWKTLQQQMDSEGVRSGVIPVRSAEGALVALANVHRYRVESESGSTTHHLLFVRPLQAGSGDAIAGELRQLFGLTAAESALVLALRHHGTTAQAAATLGIAECSARTRLQSIFEKTGTHGRAELLVLIAALAETVV